ncbi:hypothetical protein VZT92_016812 [Zoarces viviparus]|uniref:DUF5641 domain-containing protein n=1 Tax=Zoarces viviparus TaxID=48416 RepID=A0AAW1EPW7_ZOAVI
MVNTHEVIFWTDSTTVLTLHQSDSRRYKVLVGTSVAEIQELTNVRAWRYMDSVNNSADDLTRGKTLFELFGKIMVVDSQLPGAQWPPGHVTEVIPGTDERVRTAVVQIKGKTFTRPVACLVTLPTIPDIDPVGPS